MTVVKIIFVFIFMLFKIPGSSASPHIFRYIEFQYQVTKYSPCVGPQLMRIFNPLGHCTWLCLTIQKTWISQGSFPIFGTWGSYLRWCDTSQSSISIFVSATESHSYSGIHLLEFRCQWCQHPVEACCLFSGDSLDIQWHLEHDSMDQMSTPVRKINEPWSKPLWLLREPMVSGTYGHFWVRSVYPTLSGMIHCISI